MKLARFKITNFRSIEDSGWVDCDDVTTLVGINEAGKSNLLLGLWKLNPARGGEVDSLQDMPASKYAAWRDQESAICFVEAEFDLDIEEIEIVKELSGCDDGEAARVAVSRFYDGVIRIGFPNFKIAKQIDAKPVVDMANEAIREIEQHNEKTKSEAGIKDDSRNAFLSIMKYAADTKTIGTEEAAKLRGMLYEKLVDAAATSEIGPIVKEYNNKLERYILTTQPVNPSEVEEVRQYIVTRMPHFVYYSNYGNLDSRIYLPHAIKWLNGETVEGVQVSEDKVRTLRVLFEYVNLDPEEILALGKAPATKKSDGYNRIIEVSVSEDQVNDFGKNVEERFQLLSSAATALTREFKDWWRQGSYKFRFDADSDYFRILVSDEKREDEIDLEKRSTGLQWFLSFFLVFLVESQRDHKGSILLLDEAGMSLHPLAQRDLIAFFDNLSRGGQIIHTTHSPFLVDTANIDRVRAVYIDNGGHTVATSNLREGGGKGAEQSIYAAYAALGLTVSDTLLLGCQPVIVEGVSDQHYMNAIKTYLVRNGCFVPRDELVFIPAGGVKGVSSIASIVGGSSQELPYVVVDADGSGKIFKNKLVSQLYKDSKERVISVGDFAVIDNAEIEDLVPLELMEKKLNNLFRDVDEFDALEEIDLRHSRINEIERIAEKYGITLPDGWKVELAKSVKTQLLKGRIAIDDKHSEAWGHLFETFNSES